ncbi:hypothetical protein N7478_010790 [Penicillium angulare]|uniref:uncharacterized protein n=1 Tax=Penicillium angulare TaxID=116970 RepID=UPI002540C0C7|nr:uncharacterized protein N7478_010790 [Penicillium angulare]KAJ5263185.1 hypothetical protein N7478_010790 [Penicillium angulare]
MTFLFGRRRSSSDVADTDHTGQDTLAHHLSSEHQGKEEKIKAPSTDSGIFHGLFRRKSDSSLSSDSSSPPKSRLPIRQNSLLVDTRRSSSGERGRDSSRHRDRSHSRSHSRSGPPTPKTPSSPEPACEGAQSEPKQPDNIQDYLEFRLDEAIKPLEGSPDGSTLTKKDVKAILSGAPHFLLERGKHGRWYPQVIFPWDEHNPSILRMLDRKPLSHASFTLCTLHAHLPVPDDWAVKGGVPIQLHSWHRSGGFKRASFDVGVFEVPNMLANNGREPGTVGYRHFLEFDMADAARYTGPPEKARQSPNMQRVSELPATEAFELMDSYNKPYSQCLSGAVFDRLQLLREGPAAWKRIGVRDINLRTLVQRLSHLRQLRLNILLDGSTMTVLDLETPHELHNILHTQFLHPHPPPADIMPGQPESLKSQIKTLAVVLATPGVWIDFSLPEWRFRAGQILWEALPHGDGDCMNECDPNSAQKPWLNSGMERKWLLIQLLLAAELIIRLDAFVRMGMLHDPHGGLMTIQELHDFDKLRSGKVNWDLIVVRRFLDNLEISCGPTTSSPGASPSPSPVGSSTQPSTDKVGGKAHKFSFIESINRRLTSHSEPDIGSAWKCEISSPHIRQQLEGLYVFAENIGWPKLDTLKTALEQKLRNGGEALTLPAVDTDGQQRTPGNTTEQSQAVRLAKEDMYTRSQTRRCIRLRSSCMEDGDPHAAETLGWISRSWLSGFVVPGEGISHLLIGTILENDPDAIQVLGPSANLYGGFIYESRSWWSKACIVGRVLSSLNGAQTCMGWVGCDVLPRDANTLSALDPGWFEVHVERMPASAGRPRIKQGGKLALESTPLGTGDITADAFTLPIDEPTRSTVTVSLSNFTLAVNTPRRRNIIASDQASLSFEIGLDSSNPTTITLPLRYNVRFISAHECRPPMGVLSHRLDDTAQKTTDWSDFKRLPGHPLHKSFSWNNVPLASLPQHPAPQATPLSADGTPQILVIDARGSRSKETFVRAWCASVGSHALIGRAGRTCIGCCVREARAINVQVIVRIGE